jgi:hypothetical protein
VSDQGLQLRSAPDDAAKFAYEREIEAICDLNWENLSQDDLVKVAWGYYYFSVQFRENLELARNLYPDDDRLRQLDLGERNTDNLSPWPGVAAAGEKMNHDEFMRRTLTLATIPHGSRQHLEAIGQSYLARIRMMDNVSRALSLASYEDGGLERVFKAMLRAEDWDNPLLQAFRHFLTEHIRFDSDPNQGHGALCRHLTPDDRVLPFWAAFKQILVDASSQLCD